MWKTRAQCRLKFCILHCGVSHPLFGCSLFQIPYARYTYLPTYLLNPWSRVRLEKLPVSQLVNKFPTFYETRRFITALTSARLLSLSSDKSIHTMLPNPRPLGSILMLYFHLRLGLLSDLFPSGSPIKTQYISLLSSFVQHAPPISFFSIWSPD